LRLLQRASKRHPQNACIDLRLAGVLDGLGFSDAVDRRVLVDSLLVDLGAIDGIPLGFTDGAALPGGALMFTAVAEDSESSYEDGPCAGAAVGMADRDGHVRFLQPLDANHKVEGIDAQVEGVVIRLLLVTDADDENTPACLLSSVISGYPFEGGRHG
jgi:hypothetical protein